MKSLILYFIVCTVSVAAAVQCTRRESTPEQLIEQQPSGAGPEVEKRPGYFRRVP